MARLAASRALGCILVPARLSGGSHGLFASPRVRLLPTLALRTTAVYACMHAPERVIPRIPRRYRPLGGYFALVELRLIRCRHADGFLGGKNAG